MARKTIVKLVQWDIPLALEQPNVNSVHKVVWECAPEATTLWHPNVKSVHRDTHPLVSVKLFVRNVQLEESNQFLGNPSVMTVHPGNIRPNLSTSTVNCVRQVSISIWSNKGSVTIVVQESIRTHSVK